MKIIRITFLAFVITGIILTGCEQQTPDPVSYSIKMTEFTFNPKSLEAEVGQQVTLELVNDGSLEHEIMFGRDPLMKDGKPNGFQTDFFTSSGVQPKVTMIPQGADDMQSSGHGATHTGFMVVLPNPGDKATITFTVTKDMVGEWDIACFSQDGVHYIAGMEGTFAVSP